MYQNTLEMLDEQQRHAATCQSKRLVIEAVPGSGKTTTIASRLAYLVRECGLEPRRVVMLTYTNAGVADMRDRVAKLFPDMDLSATRISTIHSLANMVISRYCIVTRQTPPQLADKFAIRHAIRQITLDDTDGELWLTDEELGLYEDVASYFKNMRTTPDDDDDARDIYDDYKRAMSTLPALSMDYSDMLSVATRILERDERMQAWMNGLFDAWLIDEAQDCSPLQHDFIRVAAGDNPTTFVGDTDQSIYAFRAATPELLEALATDAGTDCVRIESNYRSDRCICSLANAFLGRDDAADTKHITATKDGRGSISFATNTSVTAQNKALSTFAGTCEGTCAILYRSNDTALPLMRLLDDYGIDYHLTKSPVSFFDSRPVADVLAMLALSADPHDEKAFARLYYKIGERISRAKMLAATQSCGPREDLFDALAKKVPYAARSCREMACALRRMRHQTPEAQIRIAMRSPYGRYLKEQGGANRVRTLKELARGLKTTPELLALIQRMRESAREHLASESTLTLSTIHSAKGLEWDNVAVISMNKGSFPKPEPETQSAMRQISAREERNLMYVAMTRARHRLLLSSSTSDVSEFMDEVRADARRLGLT